MINSCSVCGSDSVVLWDNVYSECKNCGHHFSINLNPIDIINEDLVLENMTKRDSLDRFKSKTLIEHSQDFNCLIDIGCGSGKFLYQNKNSFKNAIGIEVSPECIHFAKKLGLTILDKYPTNQFASTITFWHSLEHFKTEQIESILQQIAKNAKASTRVIISVPNSQSLLHRLLKQRDPYYDATSHFHEFSFVSLSKILEQSGFKVEKSIFSITYALFGWVQGLSNILHPQRNYFYYRFRRNNSISQSSFQDLLSVFLFAFFAPFAIVMALTEGLASEKSCVINVVAKKQI